MKEVIIGFLGCGNVLFQVETLPVMGRITML